MAKREVIRRKLQQHVIGDMRERITLRTRSIQPGAIGSSGFSMVETDIATVWAKVDSPLSNSGGQLFFSGVNLNPNTTDVFVIRFRNDITSEAIINWNNQNYEILQLFDPDRRKNYLAFASRLKGDDSKEANK